MKFEEYLKKAEVEEGLFSLLVSLKDAVGEIADLIKVDSTGKVGTKNIFGEEQLALDVHSDKILQEILKKNEYFGIYTSEESDGEIKLGDGEYTVCTDPLDGSSLVDTNLAVGTIIGIYKAKTVVGVKGDEQVAAMLGIYGPRTTIILTVKKGVMEFTGNGDGEFILSRENLKVGEGKMFAPGNLRACGERKDYLKLMNYWCENGYTLRYSGGMVPDINQILIKGKGIFAYPGYSEVPEGKLRLLYECAPMALIMEEAGGAASDGKMRILDKIADHLDKRTPILIGSTTEVERSKQFLETF